MSNDRNNLTWSQKFDIASRVKIIQIVCIIISVWSALKSYLNVLDVSYAFGSFVGTYLVCLLILCGIYIWHKSASMSLKPQEVDLPEGFPIHTDMRNLENNEEYGNDTNIFETEVTVPNNDEEYEPGPAEWFMISIKHPAWWWVCLGFLSFLIISTIFYSQYGNHHPIVVSYVLITLLILCWILIYGIIAIPFSIFYCIIS